MTTDIQEGDGESLAELRAKVRSAYDETDWQEKVDGLSDLQLYSMYAYLKRNERI